GYGTLVRRRCGPVGGHAQKDLDPILSVNAALAHCDAHDRVVVGVWVREEEVELTLVELTLKRHLLLLHLARELRVGVDELLQLQQVASVPLQALPGVDFVPVLRSFPGHSTSTDRIVPDPGLSQLLL